MLGAYDDFSDLGRACDAAVHLVTTGGTAALSVRAIAREMNLTGPALTHRWDNKERLWQLLVSTVGDRWLRSLATTLYDGAVGIVPATDEQVADARVWLAFSDLGRSDANLSFRVAVIASQERGLLRRAVEDEVDTTVSEQQASVLRATAVGLRERVCSVGEPWPAVEARRAWRSAVAAVVLRVAATPTDPTLVEKVARDHPS